MLMTCDKVRILDYRYNNGEMVGEFTGIIEVTGDMQRILPAMGSATFKKAVDAKRIKIQELHADLTADQKSVFCLYLEEGRDCE